MYMLVVLLLGHIAATAVGLDDFRMETSFHLRYTGLYENSSPSKNDGTLPSRILSQILDQKIPPWQIDKPNSSTVKLVDHSYDSQRVMARHMYLSHVRRCDALTPRRAVCLQY